MIPIVLMASSSDRDLRFVEHLVEEYIKCRAVRHQFDVLYFEAIRGIPDFKPPRQMSPSVIVLQIQCQRCTLIREDFFNPTNASRLSMGLPFVAFTKRYIYPAGYSWSKKESSKERPSPADYKHELYNRFKG